MATATEPKTKFDHVETQRRVRHPLKLVRSYIRRYIILEGVAFTLLAGVMLFWLGLACDFGLFQFEVAAIKVYSVDWIFEFNDIDPSGISSLACRIIVLTLIVLGLAALGFQKVVTRWLREFNDRAIALVLERRFPKQLGDRLITAIELADPKLAGKYGYSQAMVEKTILEAVDVMDKLPVGKVFNWRRLFGLWALLGFASFGILVTTMLLFTSTTAIFAKDWMSPYGFSWRFYDVAAIWTERNLLMMDTYWPRRSYLEIGGFQPSKANPNDMRVAQDDKQRPELRVRAFEWVIADRAAPYGWRPLRWKDLPRFVDQGTLDAVNIPKEFPHWRLEFDELEPELVGAMFDSDTPNMWSGEFQAHRQDPEVKRKISDRGADQKLNTWVDWTEWTVDKIGGQKENIALRQKQVVLPALAASAIGLFASPLGDDAAKLVRQTYFPGRTDYLAEVEPVEKVFTELEKIVEYPSNSRTIRKLVIPKFVEIKFKGKTLTSTVPYGVKDGNKYRVLLKDLNKEGIEYHFRARGENYFTPKKSISFVSDPTPASITTDTEEPAYKYHRLPGVDQMFLQGKKQVIKDQGWGISTDTNDFRISQGGKITVHVVIDKTTLAWAGMRLAKTPPALRKKLAPGELPDDQGLLVTAVELNSLAEGAKLKANDILKAFNGKAIPNDLEKFAMMVADMKADKDQKGNLVVEFELIREGKKEASEPKSLPLEVQYTPRKLRKERPIFFSLPLNPEPNTEKFIGAYKVHPDHFGFSFTMDNVVRNHDFVVEFYDEDNIRGQRRFKIEKTNDSAPFVDDLSFRDYVPRKPIFRVAQQPKKKDKSKEKETFDAMPDYSDYSKSYLITPDALIPFSCKAVDDYGLVRVGYRYKYEKVDFELIPTGGKKQPVLQIGEAKRQYLIGTAMSNFQFWPGNGISWHFAAQHMGLTSNAIERDIRIAKSYREGFVPSAGFDEYLKVVAGETVTPAALQNRLVGPAKSRQWEFDFKQQDGGFDVRKHLKELKAGALGEVGQMHYKLQIAVEATDNDVETGAEYLHVVEEDVVAPDGQKSKVQKAVILRGNTEISKNGYLSFMVVSENELLAQIAIEEEILNGELESAKKDRVDAGKDSLLEQRSKIQAPGVELEGVLTRMNEIRTALVIAGDQLTKAQQAYELILTEMAVNRIESQRVKDIQMKIITRLDHIVNLPTERYPNSGSLPRAQDSFLKAQQLVEEEVSGKRMPNVAAHQRNMNKAYEDMDQLSKDIQMVLDAMGEGIVESKLIALIASIERAQRGHTQYLANEYKRIQDELADELLFGPKDKRKKKDADKSDGKDPPKTSRLQNRASEAQFAAAGDINHGRRGDVSCTAVGFSHVKDLAMAGRQVETARMTSDLHCACEFYAHPPVWDAPQAARWSTTFGHVGVFTSNGV